MNSNRFHTQILELIRRTSAYLPPDVSQVIEMHRVLEQRGSKADLALELVSQNIGLAKKLSAPICQDTGTITFYLHTPAGFDQLELEDVCRDAVAEATAKGYLRPELRGQRHRQEHRQQPRPRQPGVPLASAPQGYGGRPPGP